jgi:hypothetical protein
MYCFLWITNLIYICYVEENRPPLWSSDQSSWLQIQRSGFDPLRYQIFWEVVSLERDPLSLVSTIEGLLGRKSSGSGLETDNTVIGIRHADHVAPFIRKSWPRSSCRAEEQLCLPLFHVWKNSGSKWRDWFQPCETSALLNALNPKRHIRNGTIFFAGFLLQRKELATLQFGYICGHTD